jgi:hypothetical protein
MLKLKAHKAETSCCLKLLMLMQLTDTFTQQKSYAHREINTCSKRAVMKSIFFKAEVI